MLNTWIIVDNDFVQISCSDWFQSVVWMLSEGILYRRIETEMKIIYKLYIYIYNWNVLHNIYIYNILYINKQNKSQIL